MPLLGSNIVEMSWGNALFAFTIVPLLLLIGIKMGQKRARNNKAIKEDTLNISISVFSFLGILVILGMIYPRK